MLSNVVDVSFWDPKKIKRFFNLVDNCVAPVTLYLPETQIADLRFNSHVRHLFMWMAVDGKIPPLKIKLHDAKDMESLTKFMTYG